MFLQNSNLSFLFMVKKEVFEWIQTGQKSIMLNPSKHIKFFNYAKMKLRKTKDYFLVLG